SGEPSRLEYHVSSRQIWYGLHCYPAPRFLTIRFADITAQKRQEYLRPLPIWDADRNFRRVFAKIGHTLVDQARCYILHRLAIQTSTLPGDMAEVGVYKGGTAKLLALTIEPTSSKTLHLFDTFSGMPPTDALTDHHHEGDLGDTSLEAVQKNL